MCSTTCTDVRAWARPWFTISTLLDDYAGALTGTYRPEELGELRDEWE